MPARAYWICDERDLFVRGVLRIVASESVRLLAVDDGQGGNKLVYPFVLASDAARNGGESAPEGGVLGDEEGEGFSGTW